MCHTEEKEAALQPVGNGGPALQASPTGQPPWKPWAPPGPSNHPGCHRGGEEGQNDQSQEGVWG